VRKQKCSSSVFKRRLRRPAAAQRRFACAPGAGAGPVRLVTTAAAHDGSAAPGLRAGVLAMPLPYALPPQRYDAAAGDEPWDWEAPRAQLDSRSVTYPGRPGRISGRSGAHAAGAGANSSTQHNVRLRGCVRSVCPRGAQRSLGRLWRVIRRRLVRRRLLFVGWRLMLQHE
jgi:hypothetical protein